MSKDGRPISGYENLYRLRSGAWMSKIVPNVAWNIENILPNVVRECQGLQKHDETGVIFLARVSHHKLGSFFRDQVPSAAVAVDVLKHGHLDLWMQRAKECLHLQQEQGFIFWHDIRKGAIMLLSNLEIAINTRAVQEWHTPRRDEPPQPNRIDMFSEVFKNIRYLDSDPTGISLLQNTLIPTEEMSPFIRPVVREYFNAGAELTLDVYTKLFPIIAATDYRTRTQKRGKR